MSDAPHIRDEVATRERYGLVGDGKELPPQLGVAWCGEDCSYRFMFIDASHALLSLRYNGDIAACPDCLRALRAVIDGELAPR